MAQVQSNVTWLAVGLAAVALLLGAANRVQQPRYGYTDVAQVVAGYPPAAEVDATIAAELAPMRERLAKQRAATEAVKAKTNAQTEQLSAQDLAILELQLLSATQRQNDLDRQLQSLETKLRKKHMAPIYADLNEQMKRFGTANGYAMIWTATTAGNLAYADDAANVTDDLLEWMSANPRNE